MQPTTLQHTLLRYFLVPVLLLVQAVLRVLLVLRLGQRVKSRCACGVSGRVPSNATASGACFNTERSHKCSPN
jgi:hypothetical protein